MGLSDRPKAAASLMGTDQTHKDLPLPLKMTTIFEIFRSKLQQISSNLVQNYYISSLIKFLSNLIQSSGGSLLRKIMTTNERQPILTQDVLGKIHSVSQLSSRLESRLTKITTN